MLSASMLTAIFWVGFVLVSAAAAAGIPALLAPKQFMRLSAFGSTWFDVTPNVPIADSRVDIDAFFLCHTRVLGGVVLAASLFWLWLIMGVLL